MDYFSELEHLDVHLAYFLLRFFHHHRELQGARDSEKPVFEFVRDVRAEVFDFGRFRSYAGKEGFQISGDPHEFIAFLARKRYVVEARILFEVEIFHGLDDAFYRLEDTTGEYPAYENHENSEYERARKETSEHELLRFDRVGNVVDEEYLAAVGEFFPDDVQAKPLVVDFPVVILDILGEHRKDPLIENDLSIGGYDSDIREVPFGLGNALDVRYERGESLVFLQVPVAVGFEVEYC